MSSVATLSGRADSLPFGDVPLHVATHCGPGFSKKDLLYHIFQSPTVPEPKASLFHGHWNAHDCTVLHTTKIDTTDTNISWGAEYYGDRLYQDPTTGQYNFVWGGNATLYTKGSYDVFLHNQGWPVYLWARVASPEQFVNCGKLRWTSWSEATLDGQVRPVVQFTLQSAPANFCATHAQLFA